VKYKCPDISQHLKFSSCGLLMFDSEVLVFLSPVFSLKVKTLKIIILPVFVWVCGTLGRGEKCVQGFGEKARRKETTRKTEA
jgi:hypothetical protein